jgi:hypothetical protein
LTSFEARKGIRKLEQGRVADARCREFPSPKKETVSRLEGTIIIDNAILNGVSAEKRHTIDALPLLQYLLKKSIFCARNHYKERVKAGV